MSLLEVQGVSKAYGGIQALRRLLAGCGAGQDHWFDRPKRLR